jgi:hypothetical protein
MAKVTNVVRFYSPPKNAILLGCDEKPQIQALDTAGPFPESMRLIPPTVNLAIHAAGCAICRSANYLFWPPCHISATGFCSPRCAQRGSAGQLSKP